MQYSDEIKLKTLKYSLILEQTASLSLAYIFDIENPTETKSLGNKNTTLSFNQKLNLLLDSGSIEKEEKEKTEIFMEVRNQFMHNNNVNSLIDVFNNLSGRLNRIKKLYPQYFTDKIDIETSLDKAMDSLFKDSILFLISFKGVRGSKINVKASEIIYKKFYETTPIAIDKALKMLVDDIREDNFEWKDKDILIQNIDLLKKQIIIYQQTEKSHDFSLKD